MYDPLSPNISKLKQFKTKSVIKENINIYKKLNSILLLISKNILEIKNSINKKYPITNVFTPSKKFVPFIKINIQNVVKNNLKIKIGNKLSIKSILIDCI